MVIIQVEMLLMTTKEYLREGTLTLMEPSFSARLKPPSTSLAVKHKPFEVYPKSSYLMETFVLMNDGLSGRYNMITFQKVSWDPVFRELGQSGYMKKRIVEYFDESRIRKHRSEIQVQVVDTPNELYAVHTLRRSGASMLLVPSRRSVVKKESYLVSTMKGQNQTKTKNKCSVNKKPDIVEAKWL